MESQDSSAPPHHHHLHHQPPPVFINPHAHHQQQHQQHHQQQQLHPNNSYPLPPNHNNNNNANNNNHNSLPNAMMQHQHQQQHQQQQNPRFPFNPMPPQPESKPLQMDQHHHYSDELPAGGGGNFSIEPARKKRGRPRKYSPDSSIGLGLSPVPAQISGAIVVHNDSGGGGGASVTPSSDTAGKRNRGRPPGSGKRQMDALGLPGVGFTPHVITVNKGEDIAQKILAFSQQGPRTVCILSANGAVSNVSLRQAAMSGGTVTYEGRFEIISLSGSFMLAENNSNHRTGALSVSLAGSDGRVLGGGVAGMLKAATPVQVIVGSFIAEGKKPKSSRQPVAAPPTNMLDFSAPITKTSPSPGVSSESADENDDSPLNHTPGPYTNSSQPIQGIPSMFSNMGWPNSMKMQ